MVPADHNGSSDRQYSLTYAISTDDVAELIGSTPSFRELLEEEKYLYVDSRFCLNDPMYIRYERKIHLTPYALSHEAE